jgi:hypothetical protein
MGGMAAPMPPPMPPSMGGMAAPMPMPMPPPMPPHASGFYPGYSTMPPPPVTGYHPATDFWSANDALTKARRSGKAVPVGIGTAIVVAILVLLKFVVFASTAASLNGQTGAQVMQRSLLAASQAGTVHIVQVSSQDGQTSTSTMDISRTGGSITGQFNGATIQALAINGVLYFNADTTYLEEALKLSPAEAKAYSGVWISTPPNNQSLNQAILELQSQTIISDLLTLSGEVFRSDSPSKGQVDLQGTLADNAFNDGSGAGDSAVLGVSSKAPFYPVSFSYSDPTNGSNQFTFSNWGEPVNLTPPPNAVSLSSIIS